MKLSKFSQLVLVAAIGLIVSTLLTACLIVTIDYVFVACSAGTSSGSAGQIQTFAADAESGALRPVDKIVSSGGTNPVALAVTSDYAKFLDGAPDPASLAAWMGVLSSEGPLQVIAGIVGSPEFYVDATGTTIQEAPTRPH